MNSIRQRREALGLTQAQLAERVATSQPQIRRLEAGERQLTKEWAERIAPHLGLSPSELMFGSASYDPPSPTGPPAGAAEHNRNKSAPDKEILVAMTQQIQSNTAGSDVPMQPLPANARLGDELPDPHLRIPVFGQAVGGVDGEFVMNGNRLDDVFSPPSLSSVAGAYAVYVAGESMEPRYFDGEIVFVNPSKRARRGDFVVAQIQAEEHGPALAYVKRFVRWNAEELVLAQYNPEKELHFPAGQVISVHLVVMGGAV
ncbi:LexA family transcriptional regulator [Hoeflea poritis]|uniref:Helix-turn-helix domain-containing protein n=1 Tax=Hoeflea poritis TaxID=2993659 RepID=A0ABT4VJ01_9HYPH|nr:S24 family peptidase [Hoeflea poritis]MDA4844102.1 helix-turn-helix domain-containing protein [Hoeflea poritis]